jgi:hypothetical protein
VWALILLATVVAYSIGYPSRGIDYETASNLPLLGDLKWLPALRNEEQIEASCVRLITVIQISNTHRYPHENLIGRRKGLKAFSVQREIVRGDSVGVASKQCWPSRRGQHLDVNWLTVALPIPHNTELHFSDAGSANIRQWPDGHILGRLMDANGDTPSPISKRHSEADSCTALVEGQRFCNFKVLNRINDPRSSVSSGVIKAALHYRKLLPKDRCTDDSTACYYSGEEDHPSVASIDPIYKRLIGYGCLILVFVSCWLGMIFLMTHDRWRRFGSRPSLLLGMTFIIFSVFLAWQGVALIFP